MPVDLSTREWKVSRRQRKQLGLTDCQDDSGFSKKPCPKRVDGEMERTEHPASF